MVLDVHTAHALALELAPRWEGIYTLDELREILCSDEYRTIQERTVNLLHLSELEAWHKAIGAMLVRSR